MHWVRQTPKHWPMGTKKPMDLDLHWHLQMDLVKPTPMRWDLNLQKVIRKQKRTQMDLNWLIPMH